MTSLNERLREAYVSQQGIDYSSFDKNKFIKGFKANYFYKKNEMGVNLQYYDQNIIF